MQVYHIKQSKTRKKKKKKKADIHKFYLQGSTCTLSSGLQTGIDSALWYIQTVSFFYFFFSFLCGSGNGGGGGGGGGEEDGRDVGSHYYFRNRSFEYIWGLMVI